MSSDKLYDSVSRSIEQQGRIGRRTFLQLSGVVGGGFVLAAVAPALSAEEEKEGPTAEQLTSTYELNAFVQISKDGKVTIYSSNPEMGQGIITALPMVIAEEMGVRWEDVEVLQSEIDAGRFGRHGAGGSTTVHRTWDQMRQMGAAAREMLIAAGSILMELPHKELTAADSKVSHASGESRTFGQLAELAAKQPIPEPGSLVFKERQNYVILGKSIPGVDNYAIATGLPMFGGDTNVPGMLYAAYQKCPAIGGKAVSANLDEIKAMPGVRDAFILEGNGKSEELLSGVAIVGNNTWAVFNAKNKLKIEWDESEASKDSWQGMVAKAAELHKQRGEKEIIKKGDVDKVYATEGNTVLDRSYEYAYVSHFCMEPMNCTAHYKAGKDGAKDQLELWLPTQAPGRTPPIMKAMFGVEEDQVLIHQMRLGGSFGRKIFSEHACEATAISKKVGAPIKLTWTREDDTHYDFFRVGGFQQVKGAIDKDGKLAAIENHHVGMDLGEAAWGRFGGVFRNTEFPIQNIDNAMVTESRIPSKTPVGPWRAPFSNVNAFVMQTFVDELAHKAGRDYRDFLLEVLGEPRWFEEGNVRSLNTGRAADVIKLVAEKAGWGRKMPKGSGMGLAFYFCHAAHIAEVAEVSVSADKKLTVDKVTVVADIGPIINMSGATAQVEGSIIDGLSVMAGQKITMEQGRIQQSNLHDYKVLRIAATPAVETHFIQSEYAPTGIGEPALPPLAPAIANAIFMANGERLTKMPIDELGYTIV
ncbi:MAG: molybdopterin cofactor-binding domain-containing protein [Pseudomonadota bacterium]